MEQATLAQEKKKKKRRFFSFSRNTLVGSSSSCDDDSFVWRVVGGSFGFSAMLFVVTIGD